MKKFATPLVVLLLLVIVTGSLSGINSDGVADFMPSIRYGIAHNDGWLIASTVFLVIWLAIFFAGIVKWFVEKMKQWGWGN